MPGAFYKIFLGLHRGRQYLRDKQNHDRAVGSVHKNAESNRELLSGSDFRQLAFLYEILFLYFGKAIENKMKAKRQNDFFINLLQNRDFVFLWWTFHAFSCVFPKDTEIILFLAGNTKRKHSENRTVAAFSECFLQNNYFTSDNVHYVK